MKKKLWFRKNTDGQSLVEFALVLPILMVLILGMVEFGWILNGQITLTNAVREGARSAVVCIDETTALTAASTAAERYEGVSSLTHVTIQDFTFNQTTKIAAIKVTAKVKPIVGLFNDILHLDADGNVTLSATAQMRIE